MICGKARKAHVRSVRGFESKKAKHERQRERRNAVPWLYLGIDGEGQGRRRHNYVLLAVGDKSGKRRWWVENAEGLSTIQCLNFILRLPTERTKLFGFSFNYDLTKILQDCDEKTLYDLFRPEERPGKKGPHSIFWQGYELNLQGSKFTVGRDGRQAIVWDIFKYYQSKFVKALADWKVGDPAVVKRMIYMKDHRHEFDKLDPNDVRQYCFEECQYMAELASKLVDATNAAGLTQTSFHGAGSIASALFKKLRIEEKLVDPPKEMNFALACGFAGGRFENSVIGYLQDPLIISKDISSAYPYQITFLPCLLHAQWELTKDRRMLDAPDVTGALVSYGLGPTTEEAWGPFPFRAGDGTICFPVESGGGWVWRDEYLAGERYFPNVQFREAWILRGSGCGCQPFKAIPDYYKERMRIGKEGPGIIIKLGYNAGYGKIAQSKGNPRFNNWAYAGMITSGCRAQGLHMLGLHKDRWNLLLIATDGIYTREDFPSPEPLNTGTFAIENARCEDCGTHKCKCGGAGTYTETNKPLGGWERKEIKGGLCVVRPGIYFPPNPSEKQLKDIRGRGIGRGVVLENWPRIVEALQKHGAGTDAEPTIVKVANVTRFCGAKTSISRSGPRGGPYEYHRANGDGVEVREHYARAGRWMRHAREADNAEDYARCLKGCADALGKARNAPNYGQWVTREVELNFRPRPKRIGVHADGVRLKVPRISSQYASAPYREVQKSQEAKELRAFLQEMSEQPDPDLSSYEHEDLHAEF